jgi:uncharacterized protein (TIGR02246 family)
MLRLLIILPALAIGLVMPAGAQQTISEQDSRQTAQNFVDAFNRGLQTKDAAALGALYTEDAILITPEGPISGRAEIEKRHAAGFKVFTQTEPSKLDQFKVIGNGVRIKSGTWAGTVQGPNGPLQIRGYWATTDVNDGGTWKIRMEVDNTIPARSSEKK